MRKLFIFCVSIIWFSFAFAGEPASEADKDLSAENAMSIERLEHIVERLDKDYTRNENLLVFTYAEQDITIITDPNADRMRVVIPIVNAAALSPATLTRLMQANFDSVLDARYGIAQDTLWGSFIHRLSTLTDEDFLSGVGQTINIVNSFGTTFSSGVFIFGGGDSETIIQQQLLEQLKRDGQAI